MISSTFGPNPAMAAAMSLAQYNLRSSLSAHYAADREEETAMGMWECACHNRTKCKHAQSTQRYRILQFVLGPLADPALVRSLSMRLRRKTADTGKVASEAISDIVARLLMAFDMASASVPAMTEDALHDSVPPPKSSLAAIFDVEAATVALRNKTGYVSFSAVEGLGFPLSEADS